MIKLKHLWLEVTNHCNGNCIFCARKYAPPPNHMDFDLFKSIINQCPKAEIVQTQGFGEPLLYPHIVEAVEYAAKKGKKTIFYTNGSLLNKEMASALLEAGLWRIIFSVDDDNKKYYEYFRPGLSWERLLENVNRFQKMRTRGGYKTITTVRMCETRENLARIPLIKNFWRKHVDMVTSRFEVDIPPPTELKASPYVIGRPVKCPFPYNYLSVKANGDLVICCRDWFHVYTVANLHECGVQEAYRNDLFNAVRRSHRTGVDLPYLCHICKTERFPKRYSNEEFSPP